VAARTPIDKMRNAKEGGRAHKVYTTTQKKKQCQGEKTCETEMKHNRTKKKGPVYHTRVPTMTHKKKKGGDEKNKSHQRAVTKASGKRGTVRPKN